MRLFLIAVIACCWTILSAPSAGQPAFESDVIETSAGSLEMTFIGHGTLMFKIEDEVIHIDPVGREADYAEMPDADLILVTHDHGDHLDPEAVGHIRKEETAMVTSETCAERLNGATVLKNGEEMQWKGIGIEAVPAYNIVHERSPGQAFHPKGRGNGYILTVGDTRVYIGGDSENTPEMKALEDIDVAFLPMNVPYTMTPEMVADAALALRPGILYPYHYGDSDPQELVQLLLEADDIEVRIRDLR